MRLRRSLKLAAVITAVYLMAACSSTSSRAARQWQPTAATDFKCVAGRWEGLMIRTPRMRGDDWVILVISDTGAYEFVSYRTIGTFAGKGKLVLADGIFSATSEKGRRITLQLYADPGTGERMIRADAKDHEGFTYSADLKRAGNVSFAK